MTISGANTKVISAGGVVNLKATTTWTGNTAANNNAIQFWNGGTINNNGTFNDANAFASFIEHNVGGPHNFNNIGTYNKLSNTITTVDIGVAFNNTGMVNLNAGIVPTERRRDQHRRVQHRRRRHPRLHRTAPAPSTT